MTLKRIGIIEVTPTLLANWLGLDSEHMVVDARRNFEVFQFVIEGPLCPETAKGAKASIIDSRSLRVED